MGPDEMKLTFNIDYKTVFGQEIVLNLLHASGVSSAYRMKTTDGEHWQQTINYDDGTAPAELVYYYSMDCEGTEQRHEWKTIAHRLKIDVRSAAHYMVYDLWNDMPDDAFLYSTAFTECVNRREKTAKRTPPHTTSLRLKTRAPQLGAHDRLAIVGDHDRLGHWNVERAVMLSEQESGEWVVDLPPLTPAHRSADPVEYKFIVRRATGSKTETIWEQGDNRRLYLTEEKPGEVTVMSVAQPEFGLPRQKVAGTLVPVFSLRTKGSFGVGDFGDLKTMTDMVARTGQRALQVLPINDTTTTHTWTDSYPYSCISIFALHPQYADLRQLPPLADKAQREHFENLRKKLNDLPQIDYEQVNNAKTEYLRLLFQQEGKEALARADFKTFFRENQHWLVPYARYCHLRDTYGTGIFSQWPDHRQWDEAERKALSNSRSKAFAEVAFYYYVQYVLDKQMKDAHRHARSQGVILKGDIPIGVNRWGCDVWMEPQYYNLNGQAGAPPDGFSANGQNWSFPTYNWDEMLRDGCRWWVRRFQNMQKYFDAYRIDHVLGFFRIWEIPIESVHGLLGQFSPALGLTREEIEAHGLHFQEQLFTQPFIADWTLDRLFGARKDEIKQTYLDHDHDDIYKLKPEYSTQRKMEAALTGKVDDDELQTLYKLVSDVLFVRDRKDADKFHPRIHAHKTFMYEALWDCDKQAFNDIYEDYYYRRNNHFWYREAMKKLPILVRATGMLTCAEDLGMVPECVAWVMDELKILSLEIQSMPKEAYVRFGKLQDNPYRSVCTISTHDMPTLRQWWDEDTGRTQYYYNTVLDRQGEAPHPLPGWLARDIVKQHLQSPSMLCILALQDWLAIDDRLRLPDANAERINIPANPKNYWRYRMHLNIEDLMADNDFMANVTELVSHSVGQDR